MRNIKLIIQYDGTNYYGWQKQLKHPTVQQTIEKKLSIILQENINLIGSGRTDTGVHATGQVANFKTNNPLPLKNLFLAMNSYLPNDIRINQFEEVSDEFHARFSATQREYIYLIYNDNLCPPFKRMYYHLVKNDIDIEQINKSLGYLEGTHDFSSFTIKDDETKSKIRTINKILVEQQDKIISITIRANGFLRKMVRKIIGTVLYINHKKNPPEQMRTVLELYSQNHHYPTAPPYGLYLNKVWYPENILTVGQHITDHD